jgi:hypothetical protein
MADTVKRQRIFGGIFCVLALAASGFFALEIHAHLANLEAIIVDLGVEGIPKSMLFLDVLSLMGLLAEIAIFAGVFIFQKKTRLPCLLLFFLTLVYAILALNPVDLCDLPEVFCEHVK